MLRNWNRALEQRKNEKPVKLPDMVLPAEDLHACQARARLFVARRAGAADIALVRRQLGRYPRGMIAVAARCRVCSTPLAVVTRPLLREGVRRPTPFPTTFYLTSPQAVKAISRLEASGVMAKLTARLALAARNPRESPAADRRLLWRMMRAHLLYVHVRADLAALLGDDITHIRRVGVGGMPTRVKCLHAMVAQTLALGRGVNPIGEWALTKVSDRFAPSVCRCKPKLSDVAPEDGPGPGGVEEDR